MKTKNILLLAALAATFVLSGCKQEEPFDTQSADDAPLILKPYNESGTGSFTYVLATPDTPLFDSVTVTPSRYTTVNWYLDDQLVFTGTKINMCFPVGKYALTIEAKTEAGKSTKRTGSVQVNPYATDPYAAAPAGGRHLVPGIETELAGQNMQKVAAVILTKDLNSTDFVCTVTPTAKSETSLTITLPDTPDGTYYLRLKDDEGKLYGSDVVEIHNGAVALAGFESFVPGDIWVITGVSLKNVASVKVGDHTITELTVTETTVSLTAPAAEPGEYKLSMQNKDGSDVLFVTGEGTFKEVTTIVSAETTLWEGPVTLDWNADLVKVTSDVMAAVPVGATIFVYFDVIEAEYHAMRITTPWWGDDPISSDLVAQIDGMENNPSPHSFTYDDRCKGLVDERGAMSVVGFGLEITKITFK